MQRPAGVTILAVLNYLVGAYLVVGSMFFFLALWLGPFFFVFLCVTALFLSPGYGLWKLTQLGAADSDCSEHDRCRGMPAPHDWPAS